MFSTKSSPLALARGPAHHHGDEDAEGLVDSLQREEAQHVALRVERVEEEHLLWGR